MANFRISVSFILFLRTMFWGQDSLELSMEVKTIFCCISKRVITYAAVVVCWYYFFW